MFIEIIEYYIRSTWVDKVFIYLPLLFLQQYG